MCAHGITSLTAKFKIRGFDAGLFAVLAVFACLTLPIVMLDLTGAYDGDESLFHVPNIRKIRQHWPQLDLRMDSVSAVSPGYHYFLAAVSLMTGDSLKSLRLINWIVSLGIPVTLYLYVRRRIEGPWVSSLLLFPLVSSSFVVKSGVWVFTDNAALLLGTLAILAMLSGRTSLGFSFLIGGLSGLAVLRDSFMLGSLCR